ncbi:MAG: hypothetical protein ACPGUZ_04140, partial [Holosporaceae bacterium]
GKWIAAGTTHLRDDDWGKFLFLIDGLQGAAGMSYLFDYEEFKATLRIHHGESAAWHIVYWGYKSSCGACLST